MISWQSMLHLAGCACQMQCTCFVEKLSVSLHVHCIWWALWACTALAYTSLCGIAWNGSLDSPAWPGAAVRRNAQVTCCHFWVQPPMSSSCLQQPVSCLAFSPDASWLAVNTGDLSRNQLRVEVWDVRSLKRAAAWHFPKPPQGLDTFSDVTFQWAACALPACGLASCAELG